MISSKELREKLEKIKLALTGIEDRASDIEDMLDDFEDVIDLLEEDELDKKE